MIESGPLVKPNRAHFSLAEIIAVTGGTLKNAATGAEAVTEGVVTDTRADLKGALFLALRGARFDGHDFLAQAAGLGAVAAVVGEDYAGPAPAGLALIAVPDTTRALGDIARAHRRRFGIPVVGVTGSYGKTTTRALIVAALGGVDVLSSVANNNNEIGVPQTLLQLDHSHRFAVIEMGMRGPGQIAELARIAEPTVGVITNVGPQHIEFFEDLAGVANAKGELLRGLPADGVAVIPADSSFAAHLESLAPDEVVTFGSAQDADYRVSEARHGGEGLLFSLHDPGHAVHDVELPLPGMHNAQNAAAALAVAGVLGQDLDAVAHSLATVAVPGARLRIVHAGEVVILDDSYNAGPDSMSAALTTLAGFEAKRRIAALGAMKELGRWSEDEHRKLGQAATAVDELAWVGEETRVAQQVAGGRWFATADEAGAALASTVRAGDCVLVKGSRSVGMEKVVAAIAATSGGAA